MMGDGGADGSRGVLEGMGDFFFLLKMPIVAVC